MINKRTTRHLLTRSRITCLSALLLLGASACRGEEDPNSDSATDIIPDGTGGGEATAGSGADDSTTTSGAGGTTSSGGGSTSSGVGGATSSSSGTATGGASSSSTSSSSGGGGCTPDCSNAECGLDPVCGTLECGPCSVFEQCSAGQCVCVPQCHGQSCGSDGCGGSCGTCSTGTCENGQCSVCTSGETKCNADLDQQEVCVDGQWQTESCPSYEVCVKGSCEEVCDGRLATQTEPSVCYFPVKEGPHNALFMYSNAPNKLQGTTTANGRVGTSTTTAPIGPANGTAWPYRWYFTGNMGAFAIFKLIDFSPPVSQVRLFWRGRRTGALQTTYLTRWSITANNGSQIFASGVDNVSYAWSTHSDYIAGPLVQQFSPTLWNNMGVTPIGDGFGHPADLVELSWLMVEITD